jgi:membrane-bound lytic murein transglycosylase F
MIRKSHSFYYLAFFISICSIFWLNSKFSLSQNSQLDAILHNGELRVSSLNSSDTYYLSDNKPLGFEYELISAFADSLGVTLKLNIRDDSQQLVNDIKSRDSHISIPGRARLASHSDNVAKSTSYNTNQSVVIYRETQGIKYPRALENLLNRSIIVTSNSLQELQMLSQQAAHPKLVWMNTDTLTIYEILERVLAKEIDIAVISQKDFEAIGPFFPGLKIAFKLSEPTPIKWQLANKTDRSLINAVNQFLSAENTKTLIAELENKYYKNSNPLNLFDTLTFKRDFNQRLPGIEGYFKQAAKDTNVDWLLLAAIAYQESHWNPKAVSSTGVKGIMMLTKAAAKEVKVTDRTDPKQSIFGGAQYLQNVKKKIPKRILDPDRTFLALAGYNTGFGHLEDARILAKRAGLNPDIWQDVSKMLPLLTKAKYYSTVKHGYARGYEPVTYVKNIKRYLTILKWEKEQQELKEDINITQEAISETNQQELPKETEETTAPSTL